MSDGLEFLARGGLIGLGGAALMDLWALFAWRAFGIQGLDYAMPRQRRVRDRRSSSSARLTAARRLFTPSFVLYLLVKGVRSAQRTTPASVADRAMGSVSSLQPWHSGSSGPEPR